MNGLAYQRLTVLMKESVLKVIKMEINAASYYGLCPWTYSSIYAPHPSTHPPTHSSIYTSIQPPTQPSCTHPTIIHPPLIICSSIHPTNHPSMHPSIHHSLSVNPFINPSINPTHYPPVIRSSIPLSIHPPIHPHYLSIHPPLIIHPSIHPMNSPVIVRVPIVLFNLWL